MAVCSALVSLAVGGYLVVSINSLIRKYTTDHDANIITILTAQFASCEPIRLIANLSNFQWPHVFFVFIIGALIGSINLTSIVLFIWLVCILYNTMRPIALSCLGRWLPTAPVAPVAPEAQNLDAALNTPALRFTTEDLKYMARLPINLGQLTSEEFSVVIAERASIEDDRCAEPDLLAAALF